MCIKKNIIEWQDLGTLPYAEALSLQQRLREKRLAGDIADQLLFLEHPPVITLGRKECHDDIVSPPDNLQRDGIEVVKTDRGGRSTYHGPGQLVGYAIVSIRGFGMGVKEFVSAIEEVCVRALSDFGVKAARDPEHPGLWVGGNKIVAVGLSVTRGITMHGFALNVDCDLAPYRHIVACGIAGRGVTSMKRELGGAPERTSVNERIRAHVRTIFNCMLMERNGEGD